MKKLKTSLTPINNNTEINRPVKLYGKLILFSCPNQDASVRWKKIFIFSETDEEKSLLIRVIFSPTLFYFIFFSIP